MMQDAHTTTSVSLHITGMSCASCVGRVEKNILKLDGVHSVQVSLLNKSADVTYDPSKVDVQQLIKAVNDSGYQARPIHTAEHMEGHTAHEHGIPLLSLRIIIALLLSIPVVVASMLHLPSHPHGLMSPLLQLILTTPVVLWAGWPILMAAGRAIRAKYADMNVLIAMGTLTAYSYSVIATLFPNQLRAHGIEPHVYFEAAAAITSIILIGRLLEERARGRASRAIQKLLALKPQTATLVQDGVERNVPLNNVVVGDILRVKPGEKVPLDGIITDGHTTIDESILTGESEHIHKEKGDQIIGGSLNLTGTFLMRTTAIGHETVLAHMIELVRRAQASKAPIQALADRVTSIFVPSVIGLAILAFLVWLIVGIHTGSPEAFPKALLAAISVLIIACPCALGLATPIAVVMGSGKGAEKGILFRNAEAIEMASLVQRIVFDKTGTLTEGKPKVVSITSLNGMSEQDLLSIAGAVERFSEHPMAHAIYEDSSLNKEHNVTDFHSHVGKGVSAKVDGSEIKVGNPQWFKEQNISLPELDMSFGTPVMMALDGKPAAVFYIADKLRPTTKAAMAQLAKLGIETWMLTGDRKEIAQKIAKEVGMRRFLAETTPEGKLDELKTLKSGGYKVAMVGDGINDAPALATADLGIAMSGGTDVAIETATVTLMRPELTLVPQTIILGRKTMQTIRQNLFMAFFYNVIAIPIAMLGLLSPIIASVAMVLSSLSVVINALRLRYVI